MYQVLVQTFTEGFAGASILFVQASTAPIFKSLEQALENHKLSMLLLIQNGDSATKADSRIFLWTSPAGVGVIVQSIRIVWNGCRCNL